jgi:hypothetical protein
MTNEKLFNRHSRFVIRHSCSFPDSQIFRLTDSL